MQSLAGEQAFRLKHDRLGPFEPKGRILSVSDVAGFDVERLLRLGAIEALPGVEVPKITASTEELLDDVQRVHEKCLRLEAELDQTKAALQDQFKANADIVVALRKENEKCYAILSANDHELATAKYTIERMQKDNDELKSRVAFLESNFPQNSEAKPEAESKKKK